MIRKTILGLALVSSLVSVQAIAVTQVATTSTAEDIVNQYKALRSQCAITKGEDRKNCFSNLEAKNEAYRQAKKDLAESNAKNDVRLVTLTY